MTPEDVANALDDMQSALGGTYSAQTEAFASLHSVCKRMADLIAEQAWVIEAADDLIATFADYADDLAKGLLFSVKKNSDGSISLESLKDIGNEDLCRIVAYRAARGK